MSAVAAPEPKPSPSGRLLALVRALIAFGQQIADTFRHNHPTLSPGDIVLILRRIARGLLLARALEARIVRDATRLDAEPEPRHPRSPRQPRPARPATTPRTDQTTDSALATLAALPSAEQIATEVRRRPIGAVIADICRDIGIMPSHPLWREIRDLVTGYGGNLVRLLKHILDRPFFTHPVLAWPSSPMPADALPSPMPRCIGPPRA